MACNQALGGITKDCVANRGGIKNIWIGLFDDFSVTVTNGKVSAMSLATGGAKMKKYAFAKNSASFESTPQFNELGEYAGEQGVLSMKFSKMETTKRVEITSLSYNECKVVFEDMNGVLWLLGYDNPVQRTGGPASTGAAISDTNAYTLEMTDNSYQLAYEVDSSVWTSALYD